MSILPAPTSEVWPGHLLTLWADASPARRREALRYRLALRASSKPQATDRPACPMLSGLRALELHYRHNSECRGGRQGWE